MHQGYFLELMEKQDYLKTQTHIKAIFDKQIITQENA